MTACDSFCALLLCATAIILFRILSKIYFYIKWQNKYFKRRGIPFQKPVPFLGNMASALFQRETITECLTNIYWSHQKESVIGYMQFTKPYFMIRDLELIKEITVKKFDYFCNHVFENDPKLDPIFGGTLFSMKDNKWRNTRNLFSPGFTGSKLRIMFKLMQKCADQTINALNEKLGSTDEIILDAKDFFKRYTSDTVAATVFGIDVNSFKNPDNEFYFMGNKISTFNGFFIIRLIMSKTMPWLFKALGMRLLDKTASEYFINVVKTTIKHRFRNDIERPDIINIYIEALQNGNKDLDYDEFVYQCVIIHLAGVDSSGTFFAFMAYELAMHQDVQHKVLNEIDEIRTKYGHQLLTYEMLQELKYMDMVINETLRLRTINAFALDRECTKDITLFDSHGKTYDFKKGDWITLPAYGIHSDPSHYEEPDKFIPERFSSENKDKLNPFAFLTFGIGPRMCLGARFNLFECKCIFYMLLSQFSFHPCKTTQHPLKLKKGTAAYTPENEIWLKLVKRK